MKIINSVSNPLIKKIVTLHTRDGRARENLCIVEGERAIETFLQAGKQLVTLFVTEAFKGENRVLVSDAVMKKISTATTPSGILGVFAIPENPQKPISSGIVLAQIQDPGNMGTLIRTAVALNTPTIVIVEGADPWSPKVIQASAGTIAQANIYRLSWQELVAQKKNLKLIALTVKNGKKLEELETRNSLLVVGNEANGLPTAWQDECDACATLPMPGNTESLNVAVAGSIALYIVYNKTAHKNPSTSSG